MVGRFIARENIPLAVKNDENCEGMFSFIPHIDFVSSGRFSFPQNQYNISPFSKRVPKNQHTVKVSLGAIGENAEYDRELVASILKDTIMLMVSYNLYLRLILFYF